MKSFDGGYLRERSWFKVILKIFRVFQNPLVIYATIRVNSITIFPLSLFYCRQKIFQVNRQFFRRTSWWSRYVPFFVWCLMELRYPYIPHWRQKRKLTTMIVSYFASFSFLCCPIMCLYVLSSVLWCPLRCKVRGSCLIYVICVCLCIMVTNTFSIVFSLCFSSSSWTFVVRFSGLSIFKSHAPHKWNSLGSLLIYMRYCPVVFIVILHVHGYVQYNAN